MTERTERVLGEEWKIARRQSGCGVCARVFASAEMHLSGIFETPEGLARRDYCRDCWAGRKDELLSYWQTESPVRVERKLQNTQAMTEFFINLTSQPLEGPTRPKVAYLVALLLMRKRRLKLTGSSSGILKLEKAWDGETMTLPDPLIGENELESLKLEMERLFESSGAVPTPA